MIYTKFFKYDWYLRQSFYKIALIKFLLAFVRSVFRTFTSIFYIKL